MPHIKRFNNNLAASWNYSFYLRENQKLFSSPEKHKVLNVEETYAAGESFWKSLNYFVTNLLHPTSIFLRATFMSLCSSSSDHKGLSPRATVLVSIAGFYIHDNSFCTAYKGKDMHQEMQHDEELYFSVTVYDMNSSLPSLAT